MTKLFHHVISFTPGRAMDLKCCSLMEILGLMEFKLGCPMPPSDSASTSLSSKGRNNPSLGWKSCLWSCFSWQLPTCMKQEFKWHPQPPGGLTSRCSLSCVWLLPECDVKQSWGQETQKQPHLLKFFCQHGSEVNRPLGASFWVGFSLTWPITSHK